ncbi:polysaccharide deacetylase family protein [Virgisporangium ochraceum]|uniref:Chitooligosaccharide deacetylase n=1 Tax=Virgisporangium ochraceum TaxID=65505 RepID=A0A8J4EDU2_9ACTN|nr:polysaccharide deacetylase family protein [Virgisporangium ochraceum]GIJ71049.1 chitooligosaccharide deacetylase [Virgisporangium ochraceum]
MENAPARITGLLLALVLLATLGPATARQTVRVIGRLALEPPAAAVRPPDPAGPAHPGVPAEVMSRVPRFDPPPAAVPVPLAAGPRAAWLARVPTDQPVAFITIDDGWVRLPEAVALVKAAGVPVTLFLTVNAIRGDPAYFTGFPGAGIQAHTVSHPRLKGMPYAFQRREVCGSADQLGAIYGRRPTLFRAPFGEHDATTLQVMRDCGMLAALFWKETVNDGVVRFQEGATVRRGDIILMHFRPRFVDDFIAALQAIKAAGLTPALLENYLPGAG